jgi:hypothetical protein
MGSSERTYIPGLGGNTYTINGMVNTTTDAIFQPIINAVTSVSKTVQWGVSSNRFYNGEMFITGIQYSGATNTLQTFSANFTFTGTVNKTSVSL